ncbi:MAG TPA: hypothetical protein VGK46_10165, partial [Saprospiraceae bacterium]
MQEQHPYKITPDQGWAKMKPILDKAMPEDPNKRRYPAAWWSVSAVVVAAVMSILVFDTKPSSLEGPFKNETQSLSPVTNYKSSTSTDQSVSPVVAPAEPEIKSIPVIKTQEVEKVSQKSSSTLK